MNVGGTSFSQSDSMNIYNKDNEKLILKKQVLKKLLDNLNLSSNKKNELNSIIDTNINEVSTFEDKNKILDQLATFIEEHAEELNQMDDDALASALLVEIKGPLLSEEDEEKSSAPSPFSLMNQSTAAMRTSNTSTSANIESANTQVTEESIDEDAMVAGIMSTVTSSKDNNDMIKIDDRSNEVEIQNPLLEDLRGIINNNPDLSQEEIKILVRDYLIESQSADPTDPETLDKATRLAGEIIEYLGIMDNPNLSEAEKFEKIDQMLDRIVLELYPDPEEPTPTGNHLIDSRQIQEYKSDKLMAEGQRKDMKNNLITMIEMMVRPGRGLE